ncbi:Dyp-type peroxidase [Leifsonia sp. 71-9]|uniref:Dyp-type peroxidase n=1 Tax=Leifsonia sp. 71-9 TaxID=1895934 RepID=UPI00092C285D|nr:Dyp-type peroxidase [Leifsonia sp. 71-9]OJX81460.1 MAG: peroxidase [Leifsonia sp. 71-9]
MADTSGDHSWQRVPIEPQSVDAPLSRAAVFLVVTVGDSPEAVATVKDVLGDLAGLVKTVGFRDLNAHLSCNVAIGADVWPRLTDVAPPRELHAFREFRGVHTAVATPGDLLFHIRAERGDFTFEFERLLLSALGDAVTVVDEVTGFRYFDSRDLLGFVDGTANPTGSEMDASAIVGDEDPVHAGGSYVVVQKYLHDLGAWNALGTSEQEAVIGRTKSDNVELDDVTDGRKAHKTLATIIREDGVEHDILRDNMPFGRPGQAEFGTYFIGYSRALWVIERMLERMFVGDPAGSYDRILDFSTAVTGTTFFAPTRGFLEALAD